MKDTNVYENYVLLWGISGGQHQPKPYMAIKYFSSSHTRGLSSAQNHRITETGRKPWRLSSPTAESQLEQVVQDFVQSIYKYL